MLRPFFFLLLLFFAPPLYAGSAAEIIAVVNDEAITHGDVDDRVALMFFSAGSEPNEDIKKRIRERVLKSMIDERLQLQEAKRYDVDISGDDIDRALETVAKQNGIPRAQFEDMLKEKGVPKSTLVDQIKATLAWTKVIQRVLRPQVEVGEDEINATLERIKANEGKSEFLLSEIYLAVENPADEEKVKALATDLVERMKAGASFGSLAQQFSQGTGALNGGDLGWVQPGQLASDLDAAAQGLRAGQIAPPIRLADGYHIIGKRDERIISAVDKSAIEVRLKQASLPLQGRSLAQAKEDTEKFRSTINNCGTLSTRAEQFPEWTVADMGTKKLSELPRWLSIIAEKMPTNEASNVMEKKGYALVLYVCHRNDSGSDRATITNTIGNEKLELQARRLLRDLRRDAAIDIRG